MRNTRRSGASAFSDQVSERGDEERLAAVRRYFSVEDPPAAFLDRLTELGARVLDFPVAMISVVDRDRIWLKSCFGVEAFEVDLREGFCALAVDHPGVIELRDLKNDPEHRNNPLVRELGIRSYAGRRLVCREGHALGAFAVTDKVPRKLSAGQREILEGLADLAMHHLDGWLEAREISVNEVARREKERAWLDQVVHAVTEATASDTGYAFFRVLVRSLAAQLGVRSVFVTECLGKGKVRALAAWHDGSFLESMEYEVGGAACKDVVLGGEDSIHRRRILECLPDDRGLLDVGPQAYMGVPMCERGGECLGHIAILDSSPLVKTSDFSVILRLFATRAAAELRSLRASQRARSLQWSATRIVSNAALAQLDVGESARLLNEAVVSAAAVSTSSIWLFDEGGGCLECIDRFEGPTQMHSRGATIEVARHRAYFDAIDRYRLIATEHTDTDERTRTIHEEFLGPRGVSSMLDAAISKSGRVVGIVSVETTLAHRWSHEERTYVTEVASQVAQLLTEQERRRAEEERHSFEAQMRHVQKLESIGVLAGGIAHDFNNLLVGILTNAGLARNAVSGRAEIASILRDIESSAGRAAELCKQLLAYSGKGRFVVEVTDVSGEIREMSRLIETSVSQRAEIVYELGCDLPSVEVDVAQLHQVVMNLVTNASEAVGGGGRIVIRTGARRCSKDFLAGALAAGEAEGGDYVYVSVEDNGTGMDEETRARIFEPFFTTKFAGRGLGLAAVLGIVRSHAGAILVESAPRQGTVFTILFPASEKVLADTPAEESSVRSDWTTSGVALVIDDEPAVRRVACRVLEKVGFEALSAAGGEEGLAILAEREMVDLVILDLTMPGISGLETLRRLRRHGGDATRVILSSGYNDPTDDEVSHSCPVEGFLQKPWRARELIAKIREVMEMPPAGRRSEERVHDPVEHQEGSSA